MFDTTPLDVVVAFTTLGSRPNERADCYDHDNQSCQFPIPGCPVHRILPVLNLAVPRSGQFLMHSSAGTWVSAGGVNQATQSRIICLTSVPAAVPGVAGTNYMLDGVTALPAAARVVSAVITGVTLNDARELSLKIDGDTMTQPVGSAAADTTGKVTYIAPNAAGTTTVYIYLVHQ